MIRLLIRDIKADEYTLSGSNCVSFIFASLPNWGNCLKERICFKGSKFFPFRVDHILEEICCPGKQTGSDKSICKNGGKTCKCTEL